MPDASAEKIYRKDMEMKKKLVVFTDIGDTIIDEGSEKRAVPFGVVDRADCIPGAKETMLRLYEEGFTIVMVADGLVRSFENTMRQNGLSHIFSAKVISEEMGDHKPARVMFSKAFEAAGLTDADKGRVIMVGNNLKRDIVGARRFGIRSVLIRWSPRYSYQPETEEEIPDWQIDKPEELYALCVKLESELE